MPRLPEPRSLTDVLYSNTEEAQSLLNRMNQCSARLLQIGIMRLMAHDAEDVKVEEIEHVASMYEEMGAVFREIASRMKGEGLRTN